MTEEREIPTESCPDYSSLELDGLDSIVLMFTVEVYDNQRKPENVNALRWKQRPILPYDYAPSSSIIVIAIKAQPTRSVYQFNKGRGHGFNPTYTKVQNRRVC